MSKTSTSAEIASKLREHDAGTAARREEIARLTTSRAELARRIEDAIVLEKLGEGSRTKEISAFRREDESAAKRLAELTVELAADLRVRSFFLETTSLMMRT